MNKLSEQISALVNNIRRLQARTHAEVGIVGAAIIEEQLLLALVARMRPLPADMKRKLFDGYGPLASFSAKIDLSYALHIVTKEQYEDLTAIRKIRNEFAHAIALLNFDSLAIRAHFKHFKTIEANVTDYQAYYLRKLKEIEAHLECANGETNPPPDTRSFPSEDAS
jgi:hypothetical protein